MAKVQRVIIDRDRFRECFKKRGLNVNTVSQDLGHQRGYLTECTRSGFVTAACAVALKAYYNIDRGEYELKEKEEPKVVETDDVKIDLKSLEMTIYNAVYRAVKDAWMDE